MTASAQLDGRIDWSSTLAALQAAFPNGPGAPSCAASTTDVGAVCWNNVMKKWVPVSQVGNYGPAESPLVRWRPTGNRAVTFTVAPAVGDTSKVLSANWAGASGIYPVTLSSGQILYAGLTNGATTCPFFAYPAALTGSYTTGTVTAAATTSATVGGQPPVVGVANYYSVSASIAASGTAVLAATAPDVPRNVVGAWTGTAIATVAGLDLYGNPQTEVSPSGTSLTGKKAFASITSITMSASVTGATFGTGNVLGLPMRVSSGDLDTPMFNDATDAGTFVVPDLTVPATSSTGDTRGTYTPAGTLNGVKFLSIIIKAADPATQVGTLGVTPA